MLIFYDIRKVDFAIGRVGKRLKNEIKLIGKKTARSEPLNNFFSSEKGGIEVGKVEVLNKSENMLFAIFDCFENCFSFEKWDILLL